MKASLILRVSVMKLEEKVARAYIAIGERQPEVQVAYKWEHSRRNCVTYFFLLQSVAILSKDN